MEIPTEVSIRGSTLGIRAPATHEGGAIKGQVLPSLDGVLQRDGQSQSVLSTVVSNSGFHCKHFWLLQYVPHPSYLQQLVRHFMGKKTKRASY